MSSPGHTHRTAALESATPGAHDALDHARGLAAADVQVAVWRGDANLRRRRVMRIRATCEGAEPGCVWRARLKLLAM